MREAVLWVVSILLIFSMSRPALALEPLTAALTSKAF
jgi:hypothetical protein